MMIKSKSIKTISSVDGSRTYTRWKFFFLVFFYYRFYLVRVYVGTAVVLNVRLGNFDVYCTAKSSARPLDPPHSETSHRRSAAQYISAKFQRQGWRGLHDPGDSFIIARWGSGGGRGLHDPGDSFIIARRTCKSLRDYYNKYCILYELIMFRKALNYDNIRVRNKNNGGRPRKVASVKFRAAVNEEFDYRPPPPQGRPNTYVYT